MAGSDRRKAEILLAENGFVFKRQVRHGEMYIGPDGACMLLPRQFGGPRAFANWESDLRRSLKKLPPRGASLREVWPADVKVEDGHIEPPPLKHKPEPKPVITEAVVPLPETPVTTTNKKKVPEAVLNVVTAPELSEKQKIGMLIGYGEFPQAVVAVLCSPELSQHQKMRMLSAYMEEEK